MTSAAGYMRGGQMASAFFMDPKSPAGLTGVMISASGQLTAVLGCVRAMRLTP